MILVERALRSSLGQPPDQHRARSEVRAGYLRFYLLSSWKPLGYNNAPGKPVPMFNCLNSENVFLITGLSLPCFNLCPLPDVFPPPTMLCEEPSSVFFMTFLQALRRLLKLSLLQAEPALFPQPLLFGQVLLHQTILVTLCWTHFSLSIHFCCWGGECAKLAVFHMWPNECWVKDDYYLPSE